jgi:hypothetical protein
MRISSNADWRTSLAFDTPVLVADLLPGEPAHCSQCGPASAPRPRTELWAVKLRHPMHHEGDVRFYCAEHRPAVPPPAVSTDREVSGARPGRRAPGQRTAERAPRSPARAVVEDRARAVCPDCFMEVAATGVCGNCGRAVA